MSVYSNLIKGFQLGAADPTTSGIEDVIFIGIKDQWKFILDPSNPLMVIGIRPIGGAQLIRFEGTNNSFQTASKMARTGVGPRYTEELDWNIAGNSTDIKNTVVALGYERCFAITINNYQVTDSAIEIYGFVCGLLLSEGDRSSSDETVEGGYKLKLAPPDKLREPYPPRSIFIPVSPVGVAASVPTVGTARLATATPSGVNAVASETGGALGAGTYYAKVVSVDGQGTTVGSSEVSGTIAGSTGSVVYSWNAAQGAVKYRVYIGTSAAGENKYFEVTSALNFTYTGQTGTAGSVPGSGTAYAATGIPASVTATASAGGSLANQAWFYKVTAVDPVGETLGSTEATATTSGSNNSINVTWATVPGATSYRVYRGATASGESIYFETTNLSFLDTGANLPATYENTLNVINGLVAAD